MIMDINEFSSKIIGAAIKVHKYLGPGLLESAFEFQCARMRDRIVRVVNELKE